MKKHLMNKLGLIFLLIINGLQAFEDFGDDRVISRPKHRQSKPPIENLGMLFNQNDYRDFLFTLRGFTNNQLEIFHRNKIYECKKEYADLSFGEYSKIFFWGSDNNVYNKKGTVQGPTEDEHKATTQAYKMKCAYQDYNMANSHKRIFSVCMIGLLAWRFFKNDSWCSSMPNLFFSTLGVASICVLNKYFQEQSSKSAFDYHCSRLAQLSEEGFYKSVEHDLVIEKNASVQPLCIETKNVSIHKNVFKDYIQSFLSKKLDKHAVESAFYTHGAYLSTLGFPLILGCIAIKNL